MGYNLEMRVSGWNTPNFLERIADVFKIDHKITPT